MLYLLSLHFLFIDPFLKYLNLLLESFDFLLLAGDQLGLGVEIICMRDRILLRQSLLDVRSRVLVFSFSFSRCSRYNSKVAIGRK